MKKEVAFLLVVLAFLVGFSISRTYPAHHYVALERREGDATVLLFDSRTGKPCYLASVNPSDGVTGVSFVSSELPKCGS